MSEIGRQTTLACAKRPVTIYEREIDYLDPARGVALLENLDYP